jgi:hypothetical protein
MVTALESTPDTGKVKDVVSAVIVVGVAVITGWTVKTV